MRTIYKFPIEIIDEQLVEMPKAAEILAVQVQRGVPTLWVRVNTEMVKVSRRILVSATGGPCDTHAAYVGTIQMAGGDFVWHVFDGGER